MKRRQRNVQKSVMHVQSCCFVNLNLLLFCCSRCRRRRRCLSSLMCRDRDNWCEKRADRTRPVRLACFLAWLVQAKLIFITGKKNYTIQVPPPNQRRTVQLKTVRTKFATSDTRGELGELTFAKTSGTATGNRGKKLANSWPAGPP